MQRRHFLRATAGVGVVGLAGCIGGPPDDVDSPQLDDDYEADGPEGETNSETSAEGYQLYAVSGQEVPLAPADDVHGWFEDGDTLFVDARSASEYEEIHIEGAVHSPAPSGLSSNDPLADVPTDRRIVTYCVCPHTLAGQRGASLFDAGYEYVYALDEGLQEWLDRGYPLEGTEVA